MSEETKNSNHLAISTKIPLVVIIGAALAFGGMIVQLRVLQGDIVGLKMEVRELARKVDRFTEKALSQK